MSELFVQIYLPSFNKTFDLKVSNTLKVYELQKMIYDLLKSEINTKALQKSKPVLCDKESGAIFNINLSLQELHLRNGSQLMLI